MLNIFFQCFKTSPVFTLSTPKLSYAEMQSQLP